MQELLKKIYKKSREEVGYDDEEFCADDCAGGNIDDAFSSGMDDGEVYFARELVGEFPELFELFKTTEPSGE